MSSAAESSTETRDQATDDSETPQQTNESKTPSSLPSMALHPKNPFQVDERTPEDESSSVPSIQTGNDVNPFIGSENVRGHADGASPEPPEPPGPPRNSASPHCVKWIFWRGHSTPIVTQNENGPCPLLAICNTLILANKMTLPPGTKFITSDELTAHLVAYTLENMDQENVPESQKLDFQRNCNDAMAVFPKLQTGLDVNVKFSGVRDFEFTQECVLFDLLDIHLYHGWLVDPQDEHHDTVKSLSYNQLVEKIIAGQQSEAQQLAQSPSTASETLTLSLVCQEFYNRSLSQLTYHGLSELAIQVKDEELCVFFRNNHFSTLYKRKNCLYLLITDQGYLDEPSIVWEVFSNIEGDTEFVDEHFKASRCHTATQSYGQTSAVGERGTADGGRPGSVYRGMSQEDQDLLVAMQLQENEVNDDMDVVPGLDQPSHVDLSKEPDTSRDRQLALQMQQEYDREEAERETPNRQRQIESRPTQPAQTDRPDDTSSKNKCIIL